MTPGHLTPSLPAARRILVINPNTNAAVTARVRAAAVLVASPDVAFEVCNPESGPFSIESPDDRAAAEPQVRALLQAARGRGYDACVMACFDDLCLDDAQALLGCPAIGTAGAGIAAACAIHPRFAVVTTVHAALPVIRRLLERHAPGIPCTVRAAGIGVAEAADAGEAAQARLEETVRQAIEEDGAHAILLASGGLTGRGREIERRCGVPVVDGVVAALQLAMRLPTA